MIGFQETKGRQKSYYVCLMKCFGFIDVNQTVIQSIDYIAPYYTLQRRLGPWCQSRQPNWDRFPDGTKVNEHNRPVLLPPVSRPCTHQGHVGLRLFEVGPLKVEPDGHYYLKRSKGKIHLFLPSHSGPERDRLVTKVAKIKGLTMEKLYHISHFGYSGVQFLMIHVYIVSPLIIFADITKIFPFLGAEIIRGRTLHIIGIKYFFVVFEIFHLFQSRL